MVIFAIFVICGVVGYYLWTNRKPSVPYRPARQDVLILLRKVYGGLNNELEWGTFVDLPIENDEKLEEVRKKCVAINENKEYFKNLKDGFMFNEQGMVEIRKLIVEMENYVKSKGREKTEFQQNCAHMVEQKLESSGVKLSKWEFKDGPEESYYLGEYKGIQIFVYADGASIKSSLGSAMFDRQDYNTEGELVRALMGKFNETTAMLAVQKS